MEREQTYGYQGTENSRQKPQSMAKAWEPQSTVQISSPMETFQSKAGALGTPAPKDGREAYTLKIKRKEASGDGK